MMIEENGVNLLQELAVNIGHLLSHIRSRLEEPTKVDARAIVVAGIIFQKLDACYDTAVRNMENISSEIQEELEGIEGFDISDVERMEDEIDSIVEEDEDEPDNEYEV